MNRGSFTLSGVEVRNNVGKGIWVPSESVSAFAITGNKIWNNGVGIDLGNAGGSYAVTGNVITKNGGASDFGAQSDDAQVSLNAVRD